MGLRLLMAACQHSSQPSTFAVLGATSRCSAWAGSQAGSGQRAYHITHLRSRGVISVTGEDAVQFMQGMTTNDLRPLEQPGSGPIYTVLLTAKGKYLHDLFAYRLPGDQQQQQQQQVLLDVDAAGVSSALQWLSRYKLRRKLQFEDLSSRVAVWAAFGGPLQAEGTTAGQWCQDPRLPQVGLRGLFDAQQLPPPAAEAGSSGSRKQQAAGMSVVGEEACRRWRYQLGVAEGDKEIPSGEVAPLECNLDALHGISYSKGCYIGQERNSYTHYRGVIRRRLMPVALQGVDDTTSLPCPIPIVSATASSTPAAAPSRAASIGTLTGHVGDVGMAYIKLQPALAAAEGAAPPLQLQLAGGQTVAVVPQRPRWWPQGWGREEQQQVAGASSSHAT